jgi:protein TBF1
MAIDPEPPASPLKRSRSSQAEAHNDGEQGPAEKRLKTEPPDESDMDDFARLVQQAEDSAMHDPLPLPEQPADLSQEDHGDLVLDILKAVNEAQAQDQPPADVMPEVGPAGLEEDEKRPSPESIWSNPTNYTRRKHIIPSLGHLVGFHWFSDIVDWH